MTLILKVCGERCVGVSPPSSRCLWAGWGLSLKHNTKGVMTGTPPPPFYSSPARHLTCEVSAVEVSPQGGVGRGHIKVSADGGELDHGADVQQPDDSEEEFRRKNGQTERHRQRHGCT